jgi:hypothetical protein
VLRRPISVVAAAAAALSVAAPAVARAPGGPITITLGPNRPRAAALLHVTVDGEKLDQTQVKVPTSVRIDSPRGLEVDVKAVAKTCSASQAEAHKCPSASRIATGTADLSVGLFGVTTDVTGTLTGYLAPAATAGDVAGIVVDAVAAGQRFTITGRVIPGTGSRGPSLLFSGLSGAGSLPSGVTARLKSLNLVAGATRAVTQTTKRRGKTVRKRVVHPLLTTPTTCGGTWTAAGTLTFTDGSKRTLPVSLPCKR